MRLDLYLKTSRLVLRRSVAQELCDAGYVAVNGAPAKSSREIRAGDVIDLRKRNQIMKLRVVQVPESKQVSKNSAAGLYELLEERRLDDDPII